MMSSNFLNTLYMTCILIQVFKFEIKTCISKQDINKFQQTFNLEIIFFSESSDTLLLSSSRRAKCCL